MTAEQALTGATVILVVDWPSSDVPETLTRAGYTVLVKGGPGPDDFSAWRLRDSQVDVVKVGRPAQRVDIVYAHRPVTELPAIVALAGELGARTVWCQSGLLPDGTRDPKGCWLDGEAARQARTTVAQAGLSYVDAPYIADLVRSLRAGG